MEFGKTKVNMWQSEAPWLTLLRFGVESTLVCFGDRILVGARDSLVCLAGALIEHCFTPLFGSALILVIANAEF